MKTAALVIITFLSSFLSSYSRAENGPGTAPNCCLETESVSNQNSLILDLLQKESEAGIAYDAISTSSELSKSVAKKMQLTSAADQIQVETELLAPAYAQFFSKKPTSLFHADDSDGSMLDRLQKETEAISITKPIFLLLAKIELMSSGKSAQPFMATNRNK